MGQRGGAQVRARAQVALSHTVQMGEQLLQALVERLALVIALLEEPGGVERGCRLVREQLDDFHRLKRRDLAVLWQIQRDDTEQAVLANADQGDKKHVVWVPRIGAA